jgi:hypothetical protein
MLRQPVILGCCLLGAAVSPWSTPAFAADVESRQLTLYISQDTLEAVVRKDGWTEVPLPVKGGVRKGDVVRVWAGGVIDRGGEQPGENFAGPEGPGRAAGKSPFALSPDSAHAHALLVKTDKTGSAACRPAGKPLEISVAADGEKLWIGFNDERGRFLDNHLGRGRRHEFDPLWVRVEVVRITVD